MESYEDRTEYQVVSAILLPLSDDVNTALLHGARALNETQAGLHFALSEALVASQSSRNQLVVVIPKTPKAGCLVASLFVILQARTSMYNIERKARSTKDDPSVYTRYRL